MPRLAADLLSEAIAAVERPVHSDLVFTTTGDTSVSGFSKAKARLDRLIAEGRAKRNLSNCSGMPHWTIHDLRTTFRTLASEELGADMNAVDRMLNHVASSTTSKIKRVYNRSEMFNARKEVSQNWEGFLRRLLLEELKSDDKPPQPVLDKQTGQSSFGF